MFGSKFIKFLMSILKWHVNSSSNFASLFIVMIHNSYVDFKLILFLLWIKGPHQNPNFDFQVFWWKFAIFLMSFSKPQVNVSSNFVSPFSVMKDNSCTFLGQTLNTLHNRGKWKCKFWRLASAQVKFRQILVIFEIKDQFIFKFCINIQGYEI